MKTFLFVAAVVLGSSAAASAHTPRAYEQPSHASPATVGSWRYDLLEHRQQPLGDSGRTLTGGPSGGPNQS